MAVLGALTVTVATEDGARAPDVVAYALIGATAVVLPARHRWPRAVLLGCTALLMAYYALDYAGFSPFIPLAVPLYTAGVTGHLRTGGAVATWVVLAGAVARLTEGEPALATLTGSLLDAALVGGVLLLGEAVRARRVAREAVEERLARRVLAERVRTARDLHDVLAHTVAVIGVQADVAAELFDADPPRARAAIEAVRTAGRDALADLRSTIEVLRRGDAATAPAPGLADVPGLADNARATGLDVVFNVSGSPDALPTSVDLTAYRVVQESLTNVIRHARARSVRIDVRYSPVAVEVSIRDDGTGPQPGRPVGHGLAGMRERVSALRGTFQAGARESGGFAVDVSLPVSRR